MPRDAISICSYACKILRCMLHLVIRKRKSTSGRRATFDQCSFLKESFACGHANDLMGLYHTFFPPVKKEPGSGATPERRLY